MGIRIYAYAIDVPRFSAFLDSTLAELLCRYVRDGIPSGERLTVIDRDTEDLYVATAQGSIRAATTNEAGRAYSTPTEADRPQFPVLQRSARQHLSMNSNYCARWLLQGFSRCAGIDFICRLIDGHRRWWIGSVLEYAEAVGIHQESVSREFVDLFRRMLRGCNCGCSIPAGDIGVVTEGLPFTPEDDPDFQIGRWCEHDCRLAAVSLSDILASSPRFTVPPGLIDIASDEDESEWHESVYSNVVSLLEIRHLRYRELNVLTFIG